MLSALAGSDRARDTSVEGERSIDAACEARIRQHSKIECSPLSRAVVAPLRPDGPVQLGVKSPAIT